MRGLADGLSRKCSLPRDASVCWQGKERYNFPNPNPFVEDDMDKNEVASVAYRYVSHLGWAASLKSDVSGDQTSSVFAAGTAGGSLETTLTLLSVVSMTAS